MESRSCLFPILIEADSGVSAEGTIDPLGTSAIAAALAVLLFPCVEERE
jgi:hypothetical protein